MTSITLNVTGARIQAAVNGPLTSGMVGIPVTIYYDDAWSALTKNLVCRCGQWGPEKGETRTVLNIGETATVAHEVMQADMHLYLGIEGYSTDGKLVIPTTWADCGMILHGANAEADPSTAPKLSVWAQLQAQIDQMQQQSIPEGAIAAAVAAYMEENPIEIPDTSQNVVLYEAQELTEGQKAQARENIGAAATEIVNTLNEVIMTSPTLKTALLDCRNLTGDSVKVVANSDCELVCKGQNLFYGECSYTQVGITKSASGNVVRFRGTTTSAISVLGADVNCFIPAGKIYVKVECPQRLNALSLRKSDNSNLYWFAGNVDSGQIYTAEITEPAYYLRVDTDVTADSGVTINGEYDATVYIGFEPLADGAQIPEAQMQKVSATAGVNVTVPIIEGGYIYTEDGTEFSMVVPAPPERNLSEVNEEIDALKAQMPVFMSIAEFNTSKDMMNNNSTVILLS